MPVYEYLCRVCDTRFEARRPMGEAGSPIDCPDGHADTTRLLSMFASVGHGSDPAGATIGGGGGIGGGAGGCGPGCACAS
jgi:putative FmdB family regulatory protein